MAACDAWRLRDPYRVIPSMTVGVLWEMPRPSVRQVIALLRARAEALPRKYRAASTGLAPGTLPTRNRSRIPAAPEHLGGRVTGSPTPLRFLCAALEGLHTIRLPHASDRRLISAARGCLGFVSQFSRGSRPTPRAVAATRSAPVLRPINTCRQSIPAGRARLHAQARWRRSSRASFGAAPRSSTGRSSKTSGLPPSPLATALASYPGKMHNPRKLHLKEWEYQTAPASTVLRASETSPSDCSDS